MTLALWAHRGSHAGAAPLENTLPAFERAVREAPDGVELDVHISADGVPLVFHDETTGRLAQGGVDHVIAQTPAQVLQGLELIDGGHMPTLAAVLDLLLGRLPVNVEIKDATALPAVLRVLATARSGEVVLSSFNAEAMAVAADMAPGWPRAVIHDRGVPEAVMFAQLDAARAAAWHTCAVQITPARVAAQAALGRPTRVWTVNRSEDAQALAAQGVAAIFTDQPARMRADLTRG